MLARIGGLLLIALGVGHACATVAWVNEDGHPFFGPGRFLLVVLLFASVLTAAGGVGYLVRKRWAALASITGVALLWGAPAVVAVVRFGWSNVDPMHHLLKLVAYLAILVVPAIGSMRNVRRA